MISGITQADRPLYLQNQPMEGMNQNRGKKVKNEEEYQDVLNKHIHKEHRAPYDYLAEDGVINYNGVQFFCDTEKNRLCLGDVSNPKNCLCVSLENGGCLMVNYDCIGDLSRAIGMFSVEDQNRIMAAIIMYKKAKEMEDEIAEDTAGIGDSAEASMEGGEAGTVTAGTENKDTETNVSAKEGVTEDADYDLLIREHMKEILEKLQNGTTETSFQIGGQSFTMEEWERLLSRFDKVQEGDSDVRGEDAEFYMERNAQLLTSEYTKSKLPVEDGESSINEVFYITCYTESGIICSRQGEGQIWRIDYTKDGQYERVLEYLGQLDQNADMNFAARESFWREFLSV